MGSSDTFWEPRVRRLLLAGSGHSHECLELAGSIMAEFLGCRPLALPPLPVMDVAAGDFDGTKAWQALGWTAQHLHFSYDVASWPQQEQRLRSRMEHCLDVLHAQAGRDAPGVGVFQRLFLLVRTLAESDGSLLPSRMERYFSSLPTLFLLFSVVALMLLVVDLIFPGVFGMMVHAFPCIVTVGLTVVLLLGFSSAANAFRSGRRNWPMAVGLSLLTVAGIVTLFFHVRHYTVRLHVVVLLQLLLWCSRIVIPIVWLGGSLASSFEFLRAFLRSGSILFPVVCVLELVVALDAGSFTQHVYPYSLYKTFWRSVFELLLHFIFPLGWSLAWSFALAALPRMALTNWALPMPFAEHHFWSPLRFWLAQSVRLRAFFRLPSSLGTSEPLALALVLAIGFALLCHALTWPFHLLLVWMADTPHDVQASRIYGFGGRLVRLFVVSLWGTYVVFASHALLMWHQKRWRYQSATLPVRAGFVDCLFTLLVALWLFHVAIFVLVL